MNNSGIAAIFLAGVLQSTPGLSDELTDISNYREYSPTFSSSGQPTKEQLVSLGDQGFERVVYLAFSDGDAYVDGEDVILKEAGLDYVHIPVVWDQPSQFDFYTFADIMQRTPDKKTLLHCFVNYRASAFSFLYRTVYENVPIAEAKSDMNSVWQPNEVWKDFIFQVLEENGKSPLCEGCSWDVDN